MSTPKEPQDAAASERSERSVDRWLAVAALVTAALYISLVFIRPSGESWGRGWNLIAFLIYSAPTALAAGCVALWRLRQTQRTTRTLAGWTAAAALAFPIVCMIAIRMKA